MKIKINTFALKIACKNIADKLADYDLGVVKCQERIDNMNAIWQDSLYNNFKGTVDSFMVEMNSFGKSINTTITTLNNYVQAHEDLDNEYAGRTINIV